MLAGEYHSVQVAGKLEVRRLTGAFENPEQEVAMVEDPEHPVIQVSGTRIVTLVDFLDHLRSELPDFRALFCIYRPVEGGSGWLIVEVPRKQGGARDAKAS
jgi:hypothetical protein